MNPRAQGGGLLARGVGVLGRTSIFYRRNDNVTHRSAPATWVLPRIAHRSHNSVSSRTTLRFRRETPLRLTHHLQHATAVKPAAYRNRSVVDSTFRNAAAALSGMVDDIGAALSHAKVDIIVVRNKTFEVPRGRRVSERVWTELDKSGNRKVTFSPTVEAKLVPSKEECYPTPRYKAACFFSKYQKDVETRRISTGGPDEVEWLLLLAETRQAAAEGREKQRQQQELRAKTERGAARQGNSRPDLQDDKKAVQAGGKHGEGRGGECVAGSVVSEAGTVPEPGPSGWSRFSRSPVGSKHERKGLFKAAKTFWRWAQRLYRVPWTPHRAGGVDSSFDWVTEVPASARHDVV